MLSVLFIVSCDDHSVVLSDIKRKKFRVFLFLLKLGNSAKQFSLGDRDIWLCGRS